MASQPMRMSQCRAMSIPDPTAGPLIMAIVGLRMSEMSRWSLVKAWKKYCREPSGPIWLVRAPSTMGPISSSDSTFFKSAPAQNARPAPVRTITRTSGSSSAARMYSPTLATVPTGSDRPYSALRRSGRLNVIHRTPFSSFS